MVEARRDEELDGQPDHDELGDGLGRDHLEPDGEADHPVAARAADERRAEVLRALGPGGADELADVGLGVVALRAEGPGEMLLEGLRVLVEDLVVVLERAAAVRVVLVVDGDRHDEARLPREDDEVEDRAEQVEGPADDPVNERGLDLGRAVLGLGREAGEGAEHVVRRDELAALAEHDEREAEGDAEAGEDEVVDARRRAPAAADLAGHHDAEAQEEPSLN